MNPIYYLILRITKTLNMSSTVAIARTISRFFHLFSAAYLVGQTFTFLFVPIELLADSAGYKRMFMVFGILAIITGFVNMIIVIKTKKPQKEHALWKYCLYLKLVLTILTTPLLDLIVNKISGANQ